MKNFTEFLKNLAWVFENLRVFRIFLAIFCKIPLKTAYFLTKTPFWPSAILVKFRIFEFFDFSTEFLRKFELSFSKILAKKKPEIWDLDIQFHLSHSLQVSRFTPGVPFYPHLRKAVFKSILQKFAKQFLKTRKFSKTQ